MGNPRSSRSGPTTGADLIAELNSDPAWIAAREETERREAARRAALDLEEQPILEDLRTVGVHLDTLWSQTTRERITLAALPVLLAHLRRPYSNITLDGMASALSTRVALAIWGDLVELYRESDRLKNTQGLAATLSEIATRRQLSDVLTLLRDKDLPYRQFFFRTLTRLRVPDRWEIITQCLDDPDLSVEARHLLHQRDLRARAQSRVIGIGGTGGVES
jgi:hypothetical protein